MNKRTTHEPDLLPAFRAFAILWLGLMTLMLLRGFFIDNSSQNEMLGLWLHVISAAVLVVYLYVPHLEEWLGKFYLPMALGIAIVGQLLSSSIPYLIAPMGPRDDINILQLLLNTFRQFMIWIVVVVMLGWAYDLRTVWGLLIGIFTVGVFLPLYMLGVANNILFNYLVYALFLLVALMLLGYLVVRLSEAERIQRQQLVEVNKELVQYAHTVENLTISRERNRMARELHDTLAHTLSGLAVQLETTKAFMDSEPNTAKALLEQALATTRSGLQETRHALQALRATPLEDLGLRVALIQLGESAAQRTGAKMVLDVTNDIPVLSPEIEQTLYRTTQEAIANVVKHASAQTLTLKLAVDNSITLLVADDGVSFDPHNRTENGHYGLIGMQERADLVGGRLSVSSQPGYGTQIQLTIELENG